MPARFLNRKTFNQEFTADPERQLWASVLALAINDATNEVGCTRHEHTEARNWIGDYPSANFKMVCDMAGFNPEAIHRRLRKDHGITRWPPKRPT